MVFAPSSSGCLARWESPCSADFMELVVGQPITCYPAGQVLQLESDPFERILVVFQGLAKLSGQLGNGNEEVFALLGVGDCIGVTCLIDRCASPGNVVALTPIKVARLPCAMLAAALKEQPGLMTACIGLMHQQVMALRHRLVDQNLDTTDRVLLLLAEIAYRVAPLDGKTSARWVPFFTQSELATLVGLARETISRALQHLQRQGEITPLSRRGWQLRCTLLELEARRPG